MKTFPLLYEDNEVGIVRIRYTTVALLQELMKVKFDGLDNEPFVVVVEFEANTDTLKTTLSSFRIIKKNMNSNDKHKDHEKQAESILRKLNGRDHSSKQTDQLCAELYKLIVEHDVVANFDMWQWPYAHYREWCINNGHQDPSYSKTTGPKTEQLSPGIDQLPFEGIEAIGAIFAEGELKYGRDNWKKQPDNKEYNYERTRHAIRHLMLWANGDRSEPHLAKVAWFCVTTIWREKQ